LALRCEASLVPPSQGAQRVRAINRAPVSLASQEQRADNRTYFESLMLIGLVVFCFAPIGVWLAFKTLLEPVDGWITQHVCHWHTAPMFCKR
jgi:hypothetical protein